MFVSKFLINLQWSVGVPLNVNSSGFGMLNPSCSVVVSCLKFALILVTLTSEFPSCNEFVEDLPCSFFCEDSGITSIFEVGVDSWSLHISFFTLLKSRASLQKSCTCITCFTVTKSVASSLTACHQKDSSNDASSSSHFCSKSCCST